MVLAIACRAHFSPGGIANFIFNFKVRVSEVDRASRAVLAGRALLGGFNFVSNGFSVSLKGEQRNK